MIQTFIQSHVHCHLLEYLCNTSYAVKFGVLNLDIQGFPGSSVVKIHLSMQVTRVRSLGREDSLEKEMAPHSSILAWEISWTEELVGYHPWGCKELDMIQYTQRHTHTTLVLRYSRDL